MMDFVEYTRKYLKSRLALFESKETLNEEELQEVKVLLKMLQDIYDEGYVRTYNLIEEEFAGITRLKNLLKKNHDEPFCFEKFSVLTNLTYNEETIPLMDVINSLTNNVIENDIEFFFELGNYCAYLEDLGDSNTTYVCLLRDTILPYLYLTKKGYQTKALLVGRKFLNLYGEEDEIYDSLHEDIFSSLGEPDFFSSVEKRMRDTLKKYPKLYHDLALMLSKIKTSKILVVESGYIGTIPLLLKAIDARVDFRMYSTIPYFYQEYKDKFYTNRFENMRLFETVQAGDCLMVLDRYDNSTFYVRKALNQEVLNYVDLEISKWNSLIKD